MLGRKQNISNADWLNEFPGNSLKLLLIWLLRI